MDNSVVPCCCLICRATLWVSPGGMLDGRALMFDLVGRRPDWMLMVHDCEDEDEDDEDYHEAMSEAY